MFCTIVYCRQSRSIATCSLTKHGDIRSFFDSADQKNAVRLLQLTVPTASAGRTNYGRRPVCHLNLTHCGDTKTSMRRDVSCMRTSIWMGKTRDEIVWDRLSRLLVSAPHSCCR